MLSVVECPLSTDQPDANVEEGEKIKKKGCTGGLCVWPYAGSSHDSPTLIIERETERGYVWAYSVGEGVAENGSMKYGGYIGKNGYACMHCAEFRLN